MSVRGRYSIDSKSLSEMEMTITMTMCVSEWQDLMRSLGSGYAPNRVGQLISMALGDLTRATEKIYSFPDKGEKS